ncbi:MAG: hypothetical protein U9O94_08695 [Nanoarchaeota archaeon]|nr:hypothetical protein [Nanoarchaeota archaeon]
MDGKTPTPLSLDGYLRIESDSEKEEYLTELMAQYPQIGRDCGERRDLILKAAEAIQSDKPLSDIEILIETYQRGNNEIAFFLGELYREHSAGHPIYGMRKNSDDGVESVVQLTLLDPHSLFTLSGDDYVAQIRKKEKLHRKASFGLKGLTSVAGFENRLSKVRTYINEK